MTARPRRKPKPEPTAQPPDLKAKRRPGLALLLVAVGVLVVATHWPVLSAQALLIDDGDYLTNNPLVQYPSWYSLQRFFTEIRRPSTIVGYYHPLTMASLMVDYALGGRPDNLLAFHRTSLILHLLSTLALGVLVHLLFRQPWVAALACLLFGVHPVTVEPIAWLGERKAILATCFALWSLVMYVGYVRNRSRLYYAGALGLFVLGLLAKPTVTSLPAMLLLLDYWPLGRLSWRGLLEKVPFFAVAALFTVITVTSHLPTVDVTLPTDFPLLHAPLMVGHKLSFYLGTILWPAHLSSLYPAPDPLTLANRTVLGGCLVTCAVTGLVLISVPWTRAVVTSAAFFLVGLLPVLGIIGHSPIYVWDNYLYLPLGGLVLLVAWLLARLWTAASDARRAVAVRTGAVALILIVAAAEAFATRRYLTCWRDTEVHYRHAIAQAPGAPILYNELGNYLAREGRYDEAVAEFEKAIALYPEDVYARNNLGTVLEKLGRNDEARALYNKVLQIEPGHLHAHCNLGQMFANRGQYQQAVEHYRAALKTKPDFARIHHKLGLALMELGQTEEAQRHFNAALRYQPNLAAVRTDQARLLAQQGRLEDALQYFAAELEHDPTNPKLHYNLGLTLAKQAQFDRAAQHFSEAVRLAPNDFEARSALAMALGMLGRTSEAITHYGTALDLRPDDAALHNRLGKLLCLHADFSNGVAHCREAVQRAPGQPAFALDLAWLLATHPDADAGAAPEAVTLAEQACAVIGFQDPRGLDILAAAYAAAGRFGDALPAARQAAAQAAAMKNSRLLQELEQRLALYESGRAYRAAPPPAPPGAEATPTQR